MPGGKLEMSEKEIGRLEVLSRVCSGDISQKQGAKLLKLSTRQVRRLHRRYEQDGASGLISGHRGRCNHQLPPGLKSEALSLISSHYADFGPTLANEYLHERHGIELSVESTRQLMISGGLWQSKSKQQKRIYQQRDRRNQFGELVQMDGSYHDWFEGRGDKCCLLVLIDDATGSLLDLLFCEAETTQNYFQVVKHYIEHHGLPMAFYTDKHGIFRVNIKESTGGTGLTQFGRAMEELGIELIHAHSPQAKGRVEKANRTLQDRLIKAMRLSNISSIKEANAFVPGFIEHFNQKFAKAPRCEANAHIKLQLENSALAHILSIKTLRKLTNNLECSYNNVTYQIEKQTHYHRLQNKQVTLCENYQGDVTIFYENEALPYRIFDKQNRPQVITDDKTLNTTLTQSFKKKRNPAKNNPWRQFVINPRKAARQQPNV